MSGASPAEILIEIQYHLLEVVNSGQSYSSGEWTAAEVYGYLGNRQNQLLRDSALLLKRATIVYTAGLLNQPLPDDWAITQRMVWKNTAVSPATFKELPRSDGWDADYGQSNWTTDMVSTQPLVYMDQEVPSLRCRIAPVPTNVGTPEILYVYQSPTAIAANGAMRIDEFASGVPASFSRADLMRFPSFGFSIPLPLDGIFIPEDFLPYLKWGVLADMLSKVGRAHDPVRAAYCESRFQEGIEAAKVMLSGWQGG